MNINSGNYEIWFLDYFENQLSAEQVATLFLFLEQHPHLKEEFDAFENTSIHLEDLENEILPNKSNLKKQDFISEQNIQEYFIAEIEGELPLAKQAQLQNFLQEHPQYHEERDLFQKTKLPAKNEEVFPKKNKLRRGVVLPFYQTNEFYRVAALILLLLGAAFLFNIYRLNNSSDSHVVENKDSLTVPVIIENKPENISNQRIYSSIDSISTKKEIRQEKLAEKKENVFTPIKNNNTNRLNNKALHPSAEKEKFAQSEIANRSFENKIPTLASKEIELLNVQEPILFAERRYTPKATIAYENPNEPPSLIKILQAERIANEVMDAAAKNINKAIGSELVSSSENPLKLPFKSRILKFVGNAIGKITNNKIAVRTSFDPITGNLSAYEIETKKKLIQKQFDSARY